MSDHPGKAALAEIVDATNAFDITKMETVSSGSLAPHLVDYLSVCRPTNIYAIAAYVAELEGINERHCETINTYVVSSARLEERATTAEAALAEAGKVIDAADRLNEQAAHVGTGGCIPSMTIHGAAKELLPLVAIYEAAKAEWGRLQANKGDA
jgi:hypothetical protein